MYNKAAWMKAKICFSMLKSSNMSTYAMKIKIR